jgi:nucleotide-binding universal stress UspA family protein
MFRVIAVGSDNSPRAHAAVEYAAGLAESCGARLCIVVVHKRYRLVCHSRCGAEVSSRRDRKSDVVDVEAHKELLIPVAKRLRRRGIDVDVRVLSGDPSTDLIRSAAEAGADVLVVGDRAIRGLFGGVAAAAVRSATIPVLVARTGGAPRSASQTGLPAKR